MDFLTVGWKIGLWLMAMGYMFFYSSMFLTGLSIIGIVFVSKLFVK